MYVWYQKRIACKLVWCTMSWNFEKIPISNVCLGGCTITSKTRNNVYWNFSFTPGSLRGPSTQNFYRRVRLAGLVIATELLWKKSFLCRILPIRTNSCNLINICMLWKKILVICLQFHENINKQLIVNNAIVDFYSFLCKILPIITNSCNIPSKLNYFLKSENYFYKSWITFEKGIPSKL